jgi:hypothetical protein
MSLLMLIPMSSLIGGGIAPAQAQPSVDCQTSPEKIAQKESLRQAAIAGNPSALERYRAVIAEQGHDLRQCRSRTWPRNTAIWLRLYPCDARPGVLDDVLDRIVNRGYNQVYVETFYNGQVLLPAADNPTPWYPVLRASGYEQTDLLATVIQKGRERGLKVYAWVFTLNFGYSYAQPPERQAVLARNGQGQTSMSIDNQNVELEGDQAGKAFVDPYHPQAKQDFLQLVNAVLKRHPDGVLFDYVRYPRGTGGQSVADDPLDLWIYGEASKAAFIERGLNNQGKALIQSFVSKGSINEGDVAAINKSFPEEKAPLWQGRDPKRVALPAAQQAASLRFELWQLGIAHAMQGVLDFLSLSAAPIQRRGMAAGAVFFPGGNRRIKQGYDSRLQPWDRFPSTLEWHPMIYANCNETHCIVAELQEVLKQAPAGTRVIPALAGLWQQVYRNRPPLDVQMQAIRQAVPQIDTVSHFAYAWQELKSESDRRSCRLR